MVDVISYGVCNIGMLWLINLCRFFFVFRAHRSIRFHHHRTMFISLESAHGLQNNNTSGKMV